MGAADIPMGDVDVNLRDVYYSTLKGVPTNTGTSSGGALTIWAQEYKETEQTIKLHLRALDVKNIEANVLGLGRTDPFLEIYKKQYHESTVRWQLIYRTEQVKNHLNPMWKEFQLSTGEFCDDDMDKEIKIELWDWEKSRIHRLVGALETTTNHLLEAKSERGNADRNKALPFLDDRSRYGKSRSVGKLVVVDIQLS